MSEVLKINKPYRVTICRYCQSEVAYEANDLQGCHNDKFYCPCCNKALRARWWHKRLSTQEMYEQYNQERTGE